VLPAPLRRIAPSEYGERIQYRWPCEGHSRRGPIRGFIRYAVEHPERPQRPPPVTEPDAAPGTAHHEHPHREALFALGSALALVALVYLAVVTPDKWFPGATTKEWQPRAFSLARGTGGIDRDALVVAASSGSVLVSVETDFRAADYPAIAWAASPVPDNVDVRLIWRNDYAPTKLNAAVIGVAAGQLQPVVVAGDPNWIGRIRGLALAINGPLDAPVRIVGVAAKPVGVLDIALDRLREWTAFEGVSGTLIDGVNGGANVQSLPLPMLLAVVAGLAALFWFAIARFRARTLALPSVLAVLFVAAWLADDLRWSWNLLQQTLATSRTYAGLDWRERHLAAEDAPLFQFIEGARAKLPAVPARVFVAADAHYFRGRAAYHLYPHNVYFEPYRNTIPPSSRMRPGDYFVAYQRRGVQYDAGAQRLRWDGGETVAAELLLTAPGAALFRIR
jgi:hypothetical protein